MAVTLIRPDELPKLDVYHQVAVATGTRMVFLAGQVAWDGGDLASQVEQAYLNVHTALKAAGATLKDLVKITIYVVDWTPDKMPRLLEGRANAGAKLGETPAPPATLIGVSALDVPEHLVEIEAIAVVD